KAQAQIEGGAYPASRQNVAVANKDCVAFHLHARVVLLKTAHPLPVSCGPPAFQDTRLGKEKCTSAGRANSPGPTGGQRNPLGNYRVLNFLIVPEATCYQDCVVAPVRIQIPQEVIAQNLEPRRSLHSPVGPRAGCDNAVLPPVTAFQTVGSPQYVRNSDCLHEHATFGNYYEHVHALIVVRRPLGINDIKLTVSAIFPVL